MKVSLRPIKGPWNAGWVLDKHMLKSTYLGDNAAGHPQFESVRTEVGEATFQLKYRQDWAKAADLATTLAENVCPKFPKLGFIVPMPASTQRLRQPVDEVAKELGKIIGAPIIGCLSRTNSGVSLKNLHSKEDKLAALKGTFSVDELITNDGKWNALILDDLFDSGASMEVAAETLRGYKKVAGIYVAALTWK